MPGRGRSGILPPENEERPLLHIIWDWNGTLLDDLPVTVAAANAALAPLGADPVDAEVYRDHYTRPVKLFYDRVLRRPLTEAEWLAADEIWRSSYGEFMQGAALAADAIAALERVKRAPDASQSILSMWWHDELAGLAERFGVAGYMQRMDGNDGASGIKKAGMLAKHIAALGHDPASMVVIGDSVDDAAAAVENGVRVVLYDGGTHHHHELVATGHPVAKTLLGALEWMGLGG